MPETEYCLKIPRSELSLLHDVEFTFKINDSQDLVLRAHKFILSAKSERFRGWFYGDEPKKESQAIEINDVEYEYFSKLMDFIYQVQIDLNSWAMDKVLNFYAAFEKYQIDDGAEYICDHLSKVQLSCDNLNIELIPFCEKISTSNDHRLKSAFEKCLMNHNETIMSECSLNDLDPETACFIFTTIFGSDELSPETCLDKIETYMACYSGEILVDLKSVMQPAVNKINWEQAGLETILNTKMLDDNIKVDKLMKYQLSRKFLVGKRQLHTKASANFALKPVIQSTYMTITDVKETETNIIKSELNFLRSFQSNLNNFYQDSETKDCEFKFANGTPVKAHKTVLAMSSKVFYAMFFGPMKETGPIQITDVEHSIFKMLIKMIYYKNENNLEAESSEVLSHLYAAFHKYEFQAGLDLLKPIILKRTQDIFLFFELAQMFSDTQLEADCSEILKNPLVATNSEYFLNAKPETINKVLTHPNVQIYSHEKLFNALECYIEANLHKDPDCRKNIKSSIQTLDFGTLDHACILSTKLFCDEEKIKTFATLKGFTLKTDDDLGRDVFVFQSVKHDRSIYDNAIFA